MDNLKIIILNKIKRLFVMSTIVTILLSFFDMKYGQVLGTHAYDIGNNQIIQTLDPGEAIEIPEDIEQSGGSWESMHQGWAYRQKQIYDIWVEQGQTYSVENWAYVTTNNGEKRYLVALSSIYGETGSYVDIYIEDSNGVETVYPCIMGDAKNPKDDTTHWYPSADSPDRVSYGHKRRIRRTLKCCRGNVTVTRLE